MLKNYSIFVLMYLL